MFLTLMLLLAWLAFVPHLIECSRMLIEIGGKIRG